MTPKRVLLLSLLIFISACCRAQAGRDSLFLAFWNLENFFDWKDDGQNESDREFSSDGAKRWTKARFYTKCNAVAKGLALLDPEGRLPDVAGFAEVENRFVVSQIINATFLRKYGYKVIHYDCPDPRGIDCAAIVRMQSFKSVNSFAAKVNPEHPTRDILVLQLVCNNGDSLAFLVNHHPSKHGGETSDVRRRGAVERLAFLCDSLNGEGWYRLVAMGDFNEAPGSSIYEVLETRMTCLSKTLPRDAGTIRFNGQWELIDQCWVSPSLAFAQTGIAYIPQLMVKDSSHAGQKPLRTYSGPRYLGGVSDHCPITLKLF